MAGSGNNVNQSVLNATQIDQLLSLLSYSFKNKDRSDSLANVGLETLPLEALCQKFVTIFPQKSDAFKVKVLCNIIKLIIIAPIMLFEKLFSPVLLSDMIGWYSYFGTPSTS